MNEMHAVGVKPWVTLSFNNAVYGPAGADPVKYASAGAPLPDLNNATVRAAWARYVQMLTKRYDGVVDEYEVSRPCPPCPTAEHLFRDYSLSTEVHPYID